MNEDGLYLGIDVPIVRRLIGSFMIGRETSEVFYRENRVDISKWFNEYTLNKIQFEIDKIVNETKQEYM